MNRRRCLKGGALLLLLLAWQRGLGSAARHIHADGIETSAAEQIHK